MQMINKAVKYGLYDVRLDCRPIYLLNICPYFTAVVLIVRSGFKVPYLVCAVYQTSPSEPVPAPVVQLAVEYGEQTWWAGKK